jgi:hypothetical protein
MNKTLVFCVFLLMVSGTVRAGGPQPSIVNGRPTQDEPAAGALLLSTIPGAQPPSYAGICSGTMIGCQSFLVAAHCVCENDDSLSGLFFENCKPRPSADLRVYLQNSGIHQVSEIDIPPSFEFAVASDIAVLTLATPVQGIPPIAINMAGKPDIGTSGHIMGFGVTSGMIDDYGIKRTGNIVTADCKDIDVPQPDNICWLYQGGADSNICFGDSGGPILIDQGASRVIAGVSSGVFENCQTNSFSFGTDLYANRRYINSNIAHPIDRTGKCRIDVRNRIKKYVTSIYNARKRCIDAALAGKTVLAECLSSKAKARIDKAQAALDAGKLAKRCPSEIIENSRLGGKCADAANTGQLSECLVEAGNDIVSRMLDVQYADVEADFPLADKVSAQCQKAISSSAKSYLFKSVSALNQCEARIDKAKLGTSDCPLPSTTASLQKFAAALQNKILKACSDAAVAGLLTGGDRFGASCDSKTDAATLAACEQAEHAQIANDLIDVAPGRLSAFNAQNCGSVSQVGDASTKVVQQSRSSGEAVPNADAVLHKFDVPQGIRFLRVTLNGEETFISSSFNSVVDNSFDLYLRYQQTPSLNPLVANAISVNTGVFEAIEIKNPASGEWRALVHDAGTATNRPYQLTVTMVK